MRMMKGFLIIEWNELCSCSFFRRGTRAYFKKLCGFVALDKAEDSFLWPYSLARVYHVYLETLVPAIRSNAKKMYT